MKVEVSDGEVVDKITILEIKVSRLAPEKAAHAQVELDVLCTTWTTQSPIPLGGLHELDALRAINRALWDVEDRIRDLEARADFGPAFIATARQVYELNDERARLKAAINAQTGSRLREQKSYV